MGNNGFPEGKNMTTVKVGPKGQIVIPAEVREMFGIAPGDQLLLLADTEQGIALPPKAQAGQIFAAITAAMPKRKDDKA